MSKAVLISIRPKWCELIASGKKTIEIRKTKPKIETPFKCYIYRTLPKSDDWNDKDGRVIGEFVCDWIRSFGFTPYNHGEYAGIDYIHEKSCISFSEMFDYIGESAGFGWHISDLQIYDKPKELCEFMTKPCDFAATCGACVHSRWSETDYSKFVGCSFEVKRPPQSWCYVEV